MFTWFRNLPEVAKGEVLGAFIGASITAFVGLVTIVTKGYWFPIIVEKRNAKKISKQIFKKYSNPLILASISCLYRINEIFYRGSFLLDSAPKNKFNEYKYVSSLYRLCALIGWLRASKIELSYIEVRSSKEYKIINKANVNFEKSLADGQHIEQFILNDLAKLWNIDLNGLQDIQKRKLGVDIENITHEYCYEIKVEMPSLLTDDKKKELIEQTYNIISQKTNSAKINVKTINDTYIIAAKEMSRIEGLIYRDWQSAIGDLMIKRIKKDSDRKFEVIGYKDFEQMFYSEDAEIKKWIGRVDRLFRNLDVAVEDRFDTRIQQFRNIYISTYELLLAYSKVQKGNIDISSAEIKRLKTL